MALYSIGDYIILGTLIAQVSEVKEESGQFFYRLSITRQCQDWIPEAELLGKKINVS
jgi:hypothetical protein